MFVSDAVFLTMPRAFYAMTLLAENEHIFKEIKYFTTEVCKMIIFILLAWLIPKDN